MDNKVSRKTAIGGVTIAMVILSLYFGVIIKNNRIFFIALSTYIAVIPYVKLNIKSGVLSYIASLLLAFIIIPNKIYVGVYGLFGIYPYIKHLCENLNKKFIEFTLKFLWFNVTIVLSYVLFKKLIYINFNILKPLYLLAIYIIMQFMFLIYDIIFTKFITFIQYKIKY